MLSGIIRGEKVDWSSHRRQHFHDDFQRSERTLSATGVRAGRKPFPSGTNNTRDLILNRKVNMPGTLCPEQPGRASIYPAPGQAKRGTAMGIGVRFDVFVLALRNGFMDYSLMTAFHLLLAALLLFLNAGSLTSKAASLSSPTGSGNLERLGGPATNINPADSLPPGWQKNLDARTLAQLKEMTEALQKYVTDHNLQMPLPDTLTLDDLVKARYLREIPPAPAGKKFAVSRTYVIVVVIDNK
jgi:hypothetical protein